MLDLAYLGLSATNELSADPQLESLFVGLRPGLLAEEGFDRPHTWAVPVDEGKMADTQTTTLATSQPAERRGGLLEIDAPLEQQPVFVLSVSRQPTPAVADTTSSQVNPTAKAATTAAAAEPATPLPAFLQGDAPQVYVGDDQQSMPSIAMSSYTGGGGSGGGSTGPLPGGYVAAIQVRDVDFLGDVIHVKEDPGRQPYKGGPAAPEWQDLDLNGVQDSDTEWAVPVAYVRGTRPSVKATFVITNHKGSGPQTAPEDKITIRGLWPESGMLCPEVQVTVGKDDTTVTYPETPIYSPLPGYVDSVRSAGIQWQFRRTGDAVNWYEAGSSANEMFVTLAPPIGPSYHSVISISTRASTVSTSMVEVVDKTWRAFETLSLSTVTPAYLPPVPDPPPVVPYIRTALPLTYYGNWQTRNLITKDLLRDNDGQCGSWANLFYDTLEQHGPVSGMKIMLVESGKGVAVEGFAVKKWNMPGPGGGVNPDYPYRNWFPTTSGYIRVDGNGVWRYEWSDDPAAQAKDDTGIAGQGPTTNPTSIFRNHELVYIYGTYHDPSYGLTYTSLRQFDDTAIAAYIDVRNAGKGYLDFRPNPPTGPTDDPELTERQVRP